MVLDEAGKRQSPLQFARDVLAEAIMFASNRVTDDRHANTDRLTPHERDEVVRLLEKEGARLLSKIRR